MANRAQRVAVAVALLTACGGLPAAALDFIDGKKMLVKDPTGTNSDESKKKVVILCKEMATDVAAIADPISGGVTSQLRLIINGANPTDQTFSFGLAGAGWSPISSIGFKYKGPTNGDDIKKLTLKRTPSGITLWKVILKGDVGGGSLAARPPNPASGSAGGLRLTTVANTVGDYCCNFEAGAIPTKDDAKTLIKKDPAATTACASPATTTTTTSSTTTTTGPPPPPCTPSGTCSSCGSCGPGGVCADDGEATNCGHLDSGDVCVNFPTCVSSSCTSDADCGPGNACIVYGGSPLCCAACA